MTPFSLTGLWDVTLAVEGIGNAGSQENFKLESLNAGSTIAPGPQINTQTISTGSFDTYTISFSGLTDTIDALRFTFGYRLRKYQCYARQHFNRCRSGTGIIRLGRAGNGYAPVAQGPEIALSPYFGTDTILNRACKSSTDQALLFGRFFE